MRLRKRPQKRPISSADRRGPEEVSGSLEQSLAHLTRELSSVSELSVRMIETGEGRKSALLFVSGLQDATQLETNAIRPLVESAIERGGVPETHLSSAQIATRYQLAQEALLDGKAVVLVDKWPAALVLTPEACPERKPGNPTRERDIIGPRDAFTDSLSVNMALLRGRLRSESLTTERLKIGSEAKTQVKIAYINGKAHNDTVDQIRDILQSVEISTVPEVSVLQEALDGNKYSLFPQSLRTERPDMVAFNLLQGRIAIFAEGSASALILPITFVQLFQVPEDYYLRPLIATSVRLIRLIAFILTTSAVPAYVALVSYHYDMIPIRFLTTIGEGRAPVPFTPLTEALILDIGVELLREAGVRLPKPLAQTLSVAAALVIGQSILASRLVSPALLVAVGFTSLASFAVPDYSTFLALRILRFPITLMAGLF